MKDAGLPVVIVGVPDSVVLLVQVPSFNVVSSRASRSQQITPTDFW